MKQRGKGTVTHGIRRYCGDLGLKNRGLVRDLLRVEDVSFNSQGRWGVQWYFREESVESIGGKGKNLR
jgi:hypothetical protein